MAHLIDLVGQTFGRFTVLERVNREKVHHDTEWKVRCECGTTRIVQGSNLKKGHSKSCGCIQKNDDRRLALREYRIWNHMLMRCYQEHNKSFPKYGARGIYVCAFWREAFRNFFADMGTAPTVAHTLDRIDGLGSYTCGHCEECREKNQPANCRWATPCEQAKNRKTSRWYTHDGKTLVLKDWAALLGISYIALWKRINKGMDFITAISVNPRRESAGSHQDQT